MKVKLSIGILLVALGGSAVWYFDLFRSAAVESLDVNGLYTVERGDLEIVLTERGTFKAKTSAEVRAQMRGGAKIEWIIEEGTSVEEGTILIELDKTDVKNRLEQLENQIIQYETELRAARTEEIIQEAQNKTDIEKAGLALEVAQVELEKMLEGDIPQKERELNLQIEKAESDHKRALKKVQFDEELKKEGFVTEDQCEQDEIALKMADNDLQTANLARALYREYQMPLEIKQKRAAVTEAERGRDRAQKRAEAQIEAKSARVQQKEISLKVTRDRLQKQREYLAKMTLRAPTAGIVLYGNPDHDWDDNEIKVGAQVWQNMVLITIPDTREMSVSIQVHESDIEKIEMEMPALITSDSQKGRYFDGTIIKVNSVANAGNRWSGDVKRFKVEVGVQGENLNLKPGTSAQVEIQVGEAQDVLYVPIQATYAKDGSFFCYVATAEGKNRVPVKLGRSNEMYVEVLEGLEEGERVLLYDPDLLQKESSEGGRPGRSGMEPPQP